MPQGDKRKTSTNEELELAQLAAEVVEALLVEASRIPSWLKILWPSQTYFAAKDEWFYIAVMDTRVCPDCGPRDKRTYPGDMIRLEFPWLEVESSYSIHPHVHPNCRCLMLREEWLHESKMRV
jgi:hypothetical protein